MTQRAPMMMGNAFMSTYYSLRLIDSNDAGRPFRRKLFYRFDIGLSSIPFEHVDVNDPFVYPDET
jgi:hypothetical protein